MHQTKIPAGDQQVFYLKWYGNLSSYPYLGYIRNAFFS